MTADLAAIVSQSAELQTRVVLLVGPAPSANEQLRELAAHSGRSIVSISAEVASRLLTVETSRRSLEAARAFREIVEARARDGVVLLDRLELFFDRTLNLNPLLLLRQSARSTTLVARWPGLLRNGRLQYAVVGHPEYQNIEPVGVRLVEAV